MRILLHPKINLFLSSLFIIIGSTWIPLHLPLSNTSETPTLAAGAASQPIEANPQTELETTKSNPDPTAEVTPPQDEHPAPDISPEETPSPDAIPVAPEPVVTVEENPVPETVPVQQTQASTPIITANPVPVPSTPEPVIHVPAPSVAPAQPAPVAPAPAYNDPNTRDIYVGLTGGQATVDRCQGPVLFNAPLSYPYIAEHENCGGWGRIGTLHPGMKVRLSGLVAGSYQVGKILNVKKGDTTDVLIFDSTPRAILQTCIPNTNRMVVVSLY